MLWRLLLAVVLLSVVPTATGHGTGLPADTDPERFISFPDTDRYQTLVVDLHTHSVFSDGHVCPRIRVEEAIRDGLDALAITEHLEWQPHLEDIPHPDRNRAFAAASSAAAGSDLIVIAGSEITREAPAGHMNAVFIKDANALLQVDDPPADPGDTRAYYAQAGKWPAQKAVDAANDQGAFVFWNHPYWTRQQPDGIARINEFHEKNARREKLHGIEIANGQDYSEEAHQIALDHNLALIGVSDVHDLIDWDHPPAAGQHRPVTLVLASARNPAALREALFDKRTLVWFRNLLIGREAELKPVLEASLEVTHAAYRGDSTVLEFSLRNHSDADLHLLNRGEYTFMHTGDLIVASANATTTVAVKPGTRLREVTIPFDVTNALIAPKTPAHLTLNVTVQSSRD